MKQIEKGEIFQHLSGFLKSKGIVLNEGSYASKIEKSCHLLTETINVSQQGLERAKQGIDQRLDKVRQVIHEKTAPKPPAPPETPAAATASPAATPPKSPAPPKQARKVARKPGSAPAPKAKRKSA